MYASHDVAQRAHTRRVDESHFGEVKDHRVLADGCTQLEASLRRGSGIQLAPQAEDSGLLVRLHHHPARRAGQVGHDFVGDDAIVKPKWFTGGTFGRTAKIPGKGFTSH
jgi:hypothetical protein